MMVLFSLTGTGLGAAEPSARKFGFKTLSGWNHVGKIFFANQNVDYPRAQTHPAQCWTINLSK
jgi:hypothetical protein